MHDDKILAMIGRTPGIRTMQLADQLDFDSDVVEARLKPLIAANKVRCDMVPVLGGGKVATYTLTALYASGQLGPVPESLSPAPPVTTSPAQPPAPALPPTPATPERRAYVRKTPVTKRASPAPIIDTGVPMRCCMWSDGVLEVQLAGRTLITFDADEQKLLRRAMGLSA